VATERRETVARNRCQALPEVVGPRLGLLRGRDRELERREACHRGQDDVVGVGQRGVGEPRVLERNDDRLEQGRVAQRAVEQLSADHRRKVGMDAQRFTVAHEDTADPVLPAHGGRIGCKAGHRQLDRARHQLVAARNVPVDRGRVDAQPCCQIAQVEGVDAACVDQCQRLGKDALARQALAGRVCGRGAAPARPGRRLPGGWSHGGSGHCD